MTSQEQTEANRRNALKSTGPKSTKGKARASLNALKHGLLAKDIVLPSEDEQEFEGLRRALITELGPEGSLEEHIAERIVACLWRLRRVYSIETGILVCEGIKRRDQLEDTIMYTSEAKQRLQREAQGPGPAFQRDAQYFNALSKLSRYETAIERSLFQALNAFEHLQAARREREASAPEVVDAPDNLRLVQALTTACKPAS